MPTDELVTLRRMSSRPTPDETQPPASDPNLTSDPAAHGEPPRATVSWPPSSSRRDRLVAGAMVGTRYRIVAALGRGGMGEVYRADDLELGQPVALKFLPDHLADDAVALDRLRAEVRTARQIAHPNVCRVYDIGHSGRDYFLTMEFVDGEDLSGVLRRMGAPSREKSLELARQICAGLHAAHELGVLHRDLKPANIMLDGRGRARVTDFGLAGLASDLVNRKEHAGTPAYMAPEQLMRGQVSVQSDIYSLGLVLLELFSGQSPNAGKSIEQLLQTQSSAGSQTISSIAPNVDPAVERVIEQCLSPDPHGRPASAMAIIAALPGGDPIAAALAAGETPSPQLVAAAGSAGLIPVRVAVVLLAIVLAGLIMQFTLGTRSRLINHVPLPKSAEVLTDRAEAIVAEFGYGDESLRGDSARGFSVDDAYARFLIETEPSANRFDKLSQPQPAAVRFWYRQSPLPLVARTQYPTTENISPTNPPVTARGMVNLELTPDGKLIRFTAIPPQWDPKQLTATTAPTTTPATSPSGAATPFDFNPAIRAAGFEPSNLAAADPGYVPLTQFDTRAAWNGTFAGTGLPVRIEAASFNGKLTSFAALPPWEQPNYRAQRRSEWPQVVGAVFQLLIFVGTSVLISLNFRHRRGDQRGAMRVAMFVTIIDLLTWILTSARPAPPGVIFTQFLQAFAFALLLGSLAWSLYMGLEPYIRRRSPYRLVSWSRLLEGRIRDPLVGRDLLLGLASGAIATAAVCVAGEIMAQFWPRPGLSDGGIDLIGSVRPVFGTLSNVFLQSITGAMMFLIMPLILQAILRSWMAATIVFWLFIAAFVGSRGVDFLVFAGIAWAGCLLPLYRFGVVAGASAIFCVNAIGLISPTSNFSAWYATPGLITATAIALLAVWGFTLALAGRSILTEDSLTRP